MGQEASLPQGAQTGNQSLEEMARAPPSAVDPSLPPRPPLSSTATTGRGGRKLMNAMFDRGSISRDTPATKDRAKKLLMCYRTRRIHSTLAKPMRKKIKTDNRNRRLRKNNNSQRLFQVANCLLRKILITEGKALLPKVGPIYYITKLKK